MEYFPSRLGAEDFTVTELDYIGWGLAESKAAYGDERFKAFFDGDKLGSGFAKGVVRVASWASLGSGGIAVSLDAGSGLLFHNEGKAYLLTAGHVLGGHDEVGSFDQVAASSGVGAVMSSTRLRPNEVAGRDLALVACKPNYSEDFGTSMRASTPIVRAPRRGEYVAVVGYPAGFAGVTPSGEIRFSPLALHAALKPVFSFGVVTKAYPLRIDFVVGMAPWSGMSGAPIWGSDGALLGIFAKRIETSGLGGPDTSWGGEAVEDIDHLMRFLDS